MKRVFKKYLIKLLKCVIFYSYVGIFINRIGIRKLDVIVIDMGVIFNFINRLFEGLEGEF